MTAEGKINYSMRSEAKAERIRQFGGEQVQTKMIVFPSEDGFNVLVWGKWTSGSMRVRSFDNRTAMIMLLQNLHLISPDAVQSLENFNFADSCPLYSSDEIDEASLESHGFRRV